MKTKIESSSLKIGVEETPSIAEASTSGTWGIRLGFYSEGSDSRYEIILGREEARELAKKINRMVESNVLFD